MSVPYLVSVMVTHCCIENSGVPWGLIAFIINLFIILFCFCYWKRKYVKDIQVNSGPTASSVSYIQDRSRFMINSRIDHHHPRTLTVVNIPSEQDQRHSNNVTDDLPKYCELNIAELPTYDSLFNVQGNNFSRKSLSIRTNTGMHNRFLE